MEWISMLATHNTNCLRFSVCVAICLYVLMCLFMHVLYIIERAFVFLALWAQLGWASSAVVAAAAVPVPEKEDQSHPEPIM